jgi:hypothetical protein
MCEFTVDMAVAAVVVAITSSRFQRDGGND